MAPPRSSGLGQSTLSSFFTPRPSQPPAPPKPKSSSATKRKGSSSAAPISLSDSEDEVGKGRKPEKKRPKKDSGQEAKHVEKPDGGSRLEPLYDDDELPDVPDFTARPATATNGQPASKQLHVQSDFVKSFYASGANSGSVVQSSSNAVAGPSRGSSTAKSTGEDPKHTTSSSFFKSKTTKPSAPASARSSTSATPAAVRSKHTTSAAERLQAFKHSSHPAPADELADPEKKARHEAYRRKLLVPRGRAVVYAQKEGVWAPGAEEGLLRGDAALPPRMPGEGESEDMEVDEEEAPEDDEDASSSAAGPSKANGKSKAPSKAMSHLEQFRAKSSTKDGKSKGKGKAKETGPKYTVRPDHSRRRRQVLRGTCSLWSSNGWRSRMNTPTSSCSSKWATKYELCPSS